MTSEADHTFIIRLICNIHTDPTTSQVLVTQTTRLVYCLIYRAT